MLKVGVLGAGHLGKIHLRLLQGSNKYELVGFFDPFTENAQKVAKEFGYKLFDSIEDLIKVKEAMNRPKDVQAVLELKKVKDMLLKIGKNIKKEKEVNLLIEKL